METVMKFLVTLIATALMATAAFAAHPATSKAGTPEYQAAMGVMHRDMDIAYTGNADTDFARGMVPHHQGAVDMAKTELTYGTDPKMRWLANWITVMQNQEIAVMKRWLETRGYDAPVASPRLSAVEGLKQAGEQMHHNMHIPYTNDTDLDFARGMIPHHAGAVEMARVEIAHGQDPELRQIAWGIIRSQQQEIGYMERWLGKHDLAASTLKETHGHHTHH
jgi:uncharacterized protein (DUF305 family)